MRPPRQHKRRHRRITRSDYLAAGQGFARDVAEGLKVIERAQAERAAREQAEEVKS